MNRDRIEIWNPGLLPLGWTTDKLKELHNSIPKNPLIAEPMYLTAYIERLGTGTTDIINKAKEAGLTEPKFIQDEMFRTIIYRSKTVEKTVEKILSLIKLNPHITQNQLSEETGLSRRGIEWNLKKLKETNTIKRIGPDRGGYWEILIDTKQ